MDNLASVSLDLLEVHDASKALFWVMDVSKCDDVANKNRAYRQPLLQKAPFPNLTLETLSLIYVQPSYRKFTNLFPSEVRKSSKSPEFTA